MALLVQVITKELLPEVSKVEQGTPGIVAAEFVVVIVCGELVTGGL